MYLNDYISALNSRIQSVFNGRDVQNISLNGIAQREKKGTEFRPVINNEAMSIDDTKNMVLYHRLLSVQFADENVSYGDGNGTREIYTMLCVVYGNQKTKIKKEDLISVVANSLQGKIQVTADDDIKFTAYITPISCNNDSVSVWATEYGTTEYKVRGTDAYFAITYSVDTTFKRSCVDLCFEC